MKPRHRSYLNSASLLALLLLSAPAAVAAAEQALPGDAAGNVQEALLSVSVNGSAPGEPVVVLRGPSGAFYASSEQLSTWRLKTDRAPAFRRGGTVYYLLSGLAGLNLEIAEATQTLNLRAEPGLFAQTRIAYPTLELGDEVVGGTGAFLNYDASGQLADGIVTAGGAFEAGVFTSKGVGVAGFVGRWTDDGAELVRLDSNWTIDDPFTMRSLRFGDGISRGGVGGVPLRFGGIQLARNFAVQPGFITIPLPTLRGSAALPSIVDVYVDGALRDRRDVPPGPFEIIDVPIVTGGGDVRLIVRDLLGREMLYTQSYYTAPRLLRKGLHDYSFEAGFLRRSFGIKSNDYGPLMLSASNRYGFSNSFTGEVHAEASRDVQMAGLGANVVVGDFAHVGASLAGSRSELGHGALAGLTLQRRSQGLSFGLTAEFTTDDYMALGWSKERRPPRSTIQAFAGMPVSFGSLGVSYVRRDGRNEPDAEFVSANSSFRLGGLGSLHIAARKSIRGDRGVAAEVFLTLPMGPRGSSSAGASLNDGKIALRSSVQRNLPVGNGWGYHINTTRGAVDGLDGRFMVQTGFGVHDAQLTWRDGNTGVRLSTAGGIGMIAGQPFASRQLNQSFASVKVGDYSNVRVYADNQLVGRTDRKGRIIVPRLRAFDRNKLRIELADLPLDAQVSEGETTVRPYNRHGVEVSFAVKPARAAIVRFLLADGMPLPAGSSVRLGLQSDEFISAPGGEVYLTGLEASNRAVATWSAGSCEVRFPYVDTGQAQPRLGDLRCRSITQ